MLLAASIRQFAGQFRDVPIVSIQPRATGDLSPSTVRSFQRLGVSHERHLLNTEFSNFPLANKPLSAAFLAEKGEFDTIILLDSDKAVFAEPELFQLAGEAAVAVRPVHQKLFGTSGDDMHAPHWAALYKHLGIESRHRISTTMHGDELWGYWNSGLVAARASSGIFQMWRDTLIRVLRDGQAMLPHPYFSEQMSLAFAIDALKIDPLVLPAAYNYPIAYQRGFGPEGQRLAWRDVVTVHYHKMFYQPTLRHPLIPFWSERNSTTLTWFLDALDEYGLYPRNFKSSMSRKWRALKKRALG